MSTQSDVAIAEKVKIKEPSRLKVIVHNNDITSFEEVIFIVSRCFDKTESEAASIASQVHETGKGICGVYAKEVAEAKLEAVGMAKQYIIAQFPHRNEAVSALKFTLEEE